MFDRIIEYREMQQLRKDQRVKQQRRQLFIFLGVLGTLLLVLLAINAATSPNSSDAKTPERVKTVQMVPTEITQETQETPEMQDIQAFADAVTKPLDTLSDEDLDLIGSKAGDPCYEANAMLPADQMI